MNPSSVEPPDLIPDQTCGGARGRMETIDLLPAVQPMAGCELGHCDLKYPKILLRAARRTEEVQTVTAGQFNSNTHQQTLPPLLRV